MNLTGYVKVKTRTYDYTEWVSKLLNNKNKILRYKTSSRLEKDVEENNSVKNERLK